MRRENRPSCGEVKAELLEGRRARRLLGYQMGVEVVRSAPVPNGKGPSPQFRAVMLVVITGRSDRGELRS